MTKKEREHLEQRLLRERERALKALQQLDERAKVAEVTSDGDLTLYPFHPADKGTDNMEQEKDLLIMGKEGRLVYWIDDALRTLYKQPESYGKCIECGSPIAFERLDIVPWARLCMGCQCAAESQMGMGEAA